MYCLSGFDGSWLKGDVKGYSADELSEHVQLILDASQQCVVSEAALPLTNPSHKQRMDALIAFSKWLCKYSPFTPVILVEQGEQLVDLALCFFALLFSHHLCSHRVSATLTSQMLSASLCFTFHFKSLTHSGACTIVSFMVTFVAFVCPGSR